MFMQELAASDFFPGPADRVARAYVNIEIGGRGGWQKLALSFAEG